MDLPAAEKAELTVAVVALDREHSPAEARRFQFLENALQRAASRGVRLVAIPIGAPLPGSSSHTYFSALAARFRLFLASGFMDGGMVKGAIFGPDGVLRGETAQAHTLPGEAIRPGDSIAPIDTELGKIGLTLQSDLYFPEAHWCLAQQGADLLIHLEGERQPADHFYSVISPKIRALDLNRPFLIARPSSCLLKLVHNEEMGISGTPMAASIIYDQNGAPLATTGYTQGLAMADLRLHQHCISIEASANIPMEKGNDIWRLYFNDSRERYFGPLTEAFNPPPRPNYKKRKIKVAVITHRFGAQLGKCHAPLLALVEEACREQPDVVLLTEMEQECRPDDPAIAEVFDKLVSMTTKAESYLIIGGIRREDATPEERRTTPASASRTSHAWLWDRRGERVFESRIMLYGRGTGQGYYDTDFGRIAIRLCGDVYSAELSRLFAMQGVEVVFNPSMSWGASGLVNTELNQARAMDNGHYVVSAHLAFSDPGQRSHVIDPTGCVVAASRYAQDAILISEIDLDIPHGLFVRTDRHRVPSGNESYLAAYRTPHTHRLVPMQELLAHHRRPELYSSLTWDLPSSFYVRRDRGDGKAKF